MTPPLILPGLVSALILAHLLSPKAFDGADTLWRPQNTPPIALFGQMSSGAAPTTYALSGALFATRVIRVGRLLILVRAGRARARGAAEHRLARGTISDILEIWRV